MRRRAIARTLVSGAAGAAARHSVLLRRAGSGLGTRVGSRLSDRTAAGAAGPLLPKLTKAAAIGAALGATQFPLGRYWAETNLKGLTYRGTTASGREPKQYRPVIYRASPVSDPITFFARLLSLRWGPVEGTIAADASYYPLGTRMHVPGYGWGTVDDRGGAIKGPDRIDVYYRRRGDAVRFGCRRVDATVLPV